MCTFKRPDGLLRLLDGLDDQVFIVVPPPSVFLIVVDNSPAGEVAGICESRKGTWPIYYVHEPRPGISHARNASLAAVPEGIEFIAMIDDDEVPAPNWLDQLLDAQSRSGADIVVGATTPVFPKGTPKWVESSGFFLKPQNQGTLRDLDPDPPAATCNVLLRASLFDHGANLFDPKLALSGGEDKLLFQSLKLRGHRFAWTAAARAQENIPANRANLYYMWQEAYRRGCVKYPIKRKLKSRSALRSAWIASRMLLRSIVRIVRDLLLILISLGRGSEPLVLLALDLADSLGTISGILHIPNRHYRPGKS